MLFWHIWPNLTPITNFLGKITILICKTIFGLTFSSILENLLESFLAKSQKLWFWHFSARLAKIGQNENFYQKSGHAIFLHLLSPNFMPSFRKIVGAVSKNNSLRTDIRTYGQGWYHRTGHFRWFNILFLLKTDYQAPY